MRGAAPVVALLAVLLTLAACSTASPAAPIPFGVTTAVHGAAATLTAVVHTPAEEDLLGPRVELGCGLILKQIGTVAQCGGPDDNDNDNFGARSIIDKIAVDPKCDQYTHKPARGHRLVPTMRVETGPTFDQPAEGSPQYYRWSTTAPDGITQGPPPSSQDCHSANAWLQEFRASAKYRGEVTVETRCAVLVVGQADRVEHVAQHLLDRHAVALGRADLALLPAQRRGAPPAPRTGRPAAIAPRPGRRPVVDPASPHAGSSARTAATGRSCGARAPCLLHTVVPVTAQN